MVDVRSSSADGLKAARSWRVELNSYRQAFGREWRLTSTKEYDAVLTRPTVRYSGQFFSIVARDTAMKHPRLGVIVPRRHVKRAVQRNTIKRQIRESFRKSQTVLPPMDIVVMAHAGVSTCSNAKSRNSLARLFADLSEGLEEKRR